jgi:hypothetical protein
MSEKKEKQNVINPVPWLVVLSLLIILIPIYYLNQKEDVTSSYEVATTEVEETEPVQTSVMKTEITSKEVESVLKQVSELITSKYYYTNAADFDSVLTWFGSDWVNPFTKSSGYIIYDGVVSIGIDLDKVEYEIDNDNQIITIKLPKERILAHEIDDSSVKTNSKESVFNNLDAKYYAELIDKLKKETETKIMNNKEYLEQVRSNTKIVIQDFFKNEEKMADYEILITSKN